jgi:hypothetical protein
MVFHLKVLMLRLVAVLAIAACASGSAIVAGKTRAPTSKEQVKVYLEPPTEFEVIGLVSASSDAGWTEQGSLNYAIAELKKQAAKLGANGVLIVASGETTAGFVYGVPVTAKTVQGKAIFVKAP